jgi:hypothetical protein
LGRLAALGWFTQNGEVAATQAVSMLLDEPQLRDALLRRLARLTETELRSWLPDLVARSASTSVYAGAQSR